jgi:hypothetical protein
MIGVLVAAVLVATAAAYNPNPFSMDVAYTAYVSLLCLPFCASSLWQRIAFGSFCLSSHSQSSSLRFSAAAYCTNDSISDWDCVPCQDPHVQGFQTDTITYCQSTQTRGYTGYVPPNHIDSVMFVPLILAYCCCVLAALPGCGGWTRL